MCVCACVHPTSLYFNIYVCLCDVQRPWVHVSSWIKILSYKTADSAQPWRGNGSCSHLSISIGINLLIKGNCSEIHGKWQMCSTMGQMYGVWRALCVFSKYSGITTVYGYNPLVTWNAKGSTKALMPCSKQFGQTALEEQARKHLSLSQDRRPKMGDVDFFKIS